MVRILAFAPFVLAVVWATDPSTTSEYYFEKQFVDHFSAADEGVWGQRYFQSASHFGGPGSPILVVVGGEGSMGEKPEIFYPWVRDVLAKRYYGKIGEADFRCLFFPRVVCSRTTNTMIRTLLNGHFVLKG